MDNNKTAEKPNAKYTMEMNGTKYNIKCFLSDKSTETVNEIIARIIKQETKLPMKEKR